MSVRSLLIALAAVVVIGCGGTTTVNPLAAAPTDLATEAPAASPAEAATATPAQKPTKKPAATKKPAKNAKYYRPKGWDGYSDVDCSDFKTHKQAQSFFKGTGGSRSDDPYGLDFEHDGIACETLP
jgi:hypothetical protein